MLVRQILEDYYKKYPIYKSIRFAIDDKCEPENLHPILILTQYVIDKFISNGNTRIAIVLPDDECNILPLIIAKYFSNVQNELDYAGSVLEDVKIGQHLRLGKAVVEFGGIIDSEDEKQKIGIKGKGKYIRFITGRKDKTTVYCPINGVHYLFEKTEGALSLYKVWSEAKKEAEEKLKNSDNLITALSLKRTALRKTMALLSAKNDFKEFVDTLYIDGKKFDEIVTYGEIDLDSPSGFKLYNKGKLDCLPSISVTTKIEELYYLLKDKSKADDVFAIFSTMEKFDEIVNNPDTFKRVLKHNIPFVAFVSEREFENLPFLTDLGFELWHWKPSTMKSDALLVDENTIYIDNKKSIYGRFSQKVNMATLADFKLETVSNKDLKRLLKLINSLSQQLYNADNVMHQLVRRLWRFFNILTGLLCQIKGEVKAALEIEFQEICAVWNEQKKILFWADNRKNVDEILLVFSILLEQEKSAKLLKIEQFISAINNRCKNVLILLPNKYGHLKETLKQLSDVKGICNIQLQTLADFYYQQKQNSQYVDYLIVPWFDKDEYVFIKQAYCYESLVFVLYDYENKWRENYVKRVDDCIPHESIRNVALELGISQEDIYDKPIDRVFMEDNDGFEEISDYNISNTIIKSTLRNGNIDKDSADAIECIPIILSEEKIAYFYPTHDVIDVTALSRGDSNKPSKKEANKLRKGDRILIRQSDKDIIKEKADILMAQNGELDLRDTIEIWITLLGIYANNKSIIEVCKALNSEGGECTFQQVRYWLSGETIMPREKDILIAIGMVAASVPELKELCDQYLNVIDRIYDAGQKVRRYHQSAGRWLTSELKNKAQEIKSIANNCIPHGTVEGIGEVYIYTVEEVLNQEITERGKINKIEEIY